jgi:hypothetical protein
MKVFALMFLILVMGKAVAFPQILSPLLKVPRQAPQQSKKTVKKKGKTLVPILKRNKGSVGGERFMKPGTDKSWLYGRWRDTPLIRGQRSKRDQKE